MKTLPSKRLVRRLRSPLVQLTIFLLCLSVGLLLIYVALVVAGQQVIQRDYLLYGSIIGFVVTAITSRIVRRRAMSEETRDG